MKPPVFEYFAPSYLAEAIDMLAQSDNARLLAGGQSLMAMLNMRYIFPDQVIDLNRIPEIDFIRAEDDEFVIGAMTRQRSLQRSPDLQAKAPIFAKALRYVGHLQTRNRGTFGGSLCQLDPSAELPAVAMTYDATVEASGPNGRRTIPFNEFPAGYMTPALAPNEILTAIRIKPWTGRVGTGFREFSRRHGDFAIAGAIAMLRSNENHIVEQAALTLFGIHEAPVRARDAESILIGQHLDADLFKTAADLCVPLATLGDTYASADYRGHVAAAMAGHALAEAGAELQSH